MGTVEVAGGVVTFCFTDIERSTVLLQDLGHSIYTDVLEEHNRILGEIVGSSLVSTEGDSFFCVFASPIDAVQAAVSAQREIESHNWPAGGRVRVRIGLHTGQARFGGADFVGLDVHRAARISAAGHGGQILLSETTRSLVDHQLPEGTFLVDLGEQHLKDLRQPEHLYQLSVDGFQDSFPPVVSKGGGDIRIPEPTTQFVGRQAKIAEVVEALTGSRLVTLVGMGGVGKTRLALEAVKTGGLARDNSVFFVGLADKTDGSSVAKAAAATMSLSEQVGRPIEATLTDYLRDRADLLIFDNCEHLIDDVAGLVENLLQSCPDVRVLATSREPLLIDSERVVAVTPMEVETGDDWKAREPSDSVRLFEIRATSVSPDFDPSQWADQVRAICQRLEGIPLAIELAAARIPFLTPPEILELLEHRISSLSSRRRGAVPRHQTMEAALDWSYELLEPELRELLCQLSVFRGGFSRDAVGRVCFEQLVDPSRVIDQLSALYERSLLQRSVAAGVTRFHLLETVREYAQRKLEQEWGTAPVLARHRAFFIEFVREQAHRLGQQDQLPALELLETEHDNIREVLDRAVSGGELEVAADLAGRLAWFWYIHGHFKEGERRAEELLENLPETLDRPWLRLLTASAQFDYRLGMFERAEGKLDRAIEHSQRAGESRLEMWARAYAATNDMFRMDLDAATEQARQAVTIAETEGDLIAFGYARMIEIGGAAAVLESQGELTAERAAEMGENVAPLAELARNVGERNVVGHVLELAGVLSFRGGDIARAREALDQSILALTELGTVGCACHCLEMIAFCAAESGLLEAGVRLIGASDGLRRTVGVKIAPMEEPFRRRPLDLAAKEWSGDRILAVQQSGDGLGSSESLQVARDVVASLPEVRGLIGN